MTVTKGQALNDRYESRRHSHVCCPLEFRRTVASIRKKRIETKRKGRERLWGVIQVVAIIAACLVTYDYLA